ncbi:hypothetical protein C9374_000584 [Naegleria lovaniensis]|uniref:Uncharacterized protein n=1 Tax=Naegleria lovaniensis TaxID=51637 RepID=A0AA88KLZ7_NAELO|nr:uncharacterized protein C9374_000584 [Naegleria lovaniensis]KAG2388420.1 hypothetical protein C9374_000584 [Naegleria lovaniensis]
MISNIRNLSSFITASTTETGPLERKYKTKDQIQTASLLETISPSYQLVQDQPGDQRLPIVPPQLFEEHTLGPNIHPNLKVPFDLCLHSIHRLNEREPNHAQYFFHALNSLRWNTSFDLLQSLIKLNEMEQHGVSFMSPVAMIRSEDMEALQSALRRLKQDLENLIQIMSAQNIVQPQHIGVKDYPNRVLNSPYYYGNKFFY